MYSEWINENIASGLLFFALEVLLIVIVLPWALTMRARRHWRATAKQIARDFLIFEETLTKPHADGNYEYMLGYTEAIESMVILMGRDIHAFPRFAAALFELMPHVVKIRRRLMLIATGKIQVEPNLGGQLNLLDKNIREFLQIFERHRRAFHSLAGRR